MTASGVPKAEKWAALYVKDTGEGPKNCYRCALYLHDTKKCLIHPDWLDLSPISGMVPDCGYYCPARGLSLSEKDNHVHPCGAVTPAESGFTWIRGDGSNCAQCVHFDAGDERCSRVSGVIDPGACCARWKNAGLEVELDGEYRPRKGTERSGG